MRVSIDSTGITLADRIHEVELLWRARFLDEAMDCIEDVLLDAGNVGRLLNLKGLVLGASGRKEEALALYRQAADADRTNAVYAGNIGAQLAMMGRRTEALAHLRRALSMNPNLEYIYEFLAGLLRQDGDEEGAQRELHRALDLALKAVDSSPLSHEAWSQVARLRWNLGQYDQAEAAEKFVAELSQNEYYGGDRGAIIASPIGGRAWRNE